MRGGRYVPYRTWNESLKNQLEIFNFVYGPKLDEWADTGPSGKGAGEIQVIWDKGLHPSIDKTFRRDLSRKGDALIRDLQADPHPDTLHADVLRTLTNTAGRLFIMLAKERGGSSLPDIATVSKMSADDKVAADRTAKMFLLELRIALLDASSAADDAYHKYPGEADAYEVGAAVKAEVISRGHP
jgi:hypothetical protein